jgi:lipopolysaccharide transport system ATP-binding protein
MSIVEVKNISKVFKNYKNPKSSFYDLLGFSINEDEYTDSTVLHNISFSLEPGQAVGIVGLNGAGKSTLLKILTGILKPSSGEYLIKGKVKSILELGIGFNPDLTGLENLYLSANLMGINEKELDLHINWIIKFSELESAINMPLRKYSSGMAMRLAFSLTVFEKIDLLIIDEALSVGDGYFQHKSFQRIQDLKKMGTSLLIVSHDNQAILNVCDKAMLLHKGECLLFDDTKNVLADYNRILAHQEEPIQEFLNTNRNVEKFGTGEASFKNYFILDNNNNNTNLLSVNQQYILISDILISDEIDDLTIGFQIKNQYGVVVFGTNTFHTKQSLKNLKEGDIYKFECLFKCNIGPGNYSISLCAHSKDSHLEKNYHWQDFAIIFSVVNKTKNIFEGTNWLSTKINLFKSNEK